MAFRAVRTRKLMVLKPLAEAIKCVIAGKRPPKQKPVVVKDLTNVDTIVVFGASINDGMLVGTTQTTGSTTGWAAWILEKFGKTVTVVDKSTPGDRMTQFLARIDTDLSSYTGNGNVAVLVDLLGGDITNNDPWGDLTEAEQQQWYDDCETIYQKVVANGNVLVPLTATFRDYYRNSTYARDDESLGSLPWIQNVLYPLAKKYAPDFWFNNRPLLEQYTITFNNWDAWSNPSDTARVHYTDNGYRALGSWVFERLGNRLWLTQFDANVTQLSAPNSTDDYGYDDVIVSIGTTSTGTSATTLGYNYAIYTGYTDFEPTPRFGFSSYLLTQASLTQGTAQTFTYTDNSVSLTRTTLANSYIRVSTASGDVVVQTITVPKANVQYRVGVLSARISTTAYTSFFSFDGGDTWHEVASTVASAATKPTPYFFTVTPDTTTITVMLRAGDNGYGYLNGISIERVQEADEFANNTFPQASVYDLGTLTEGIESTVSTSALLSVVSDLDSDTLSISEIPTSTTNCSVSGSDVFTILPATTGAVSFTYTVSDGNGGNVVVTASGTAEAYGGVTNVTATLSGGGLGSAAELVSYLDFTGGVDGEVIDVADIVNEGTATQVFSGGGGSYYKAAPDGTTGMWVGKYGATTNGITGTIWMGFKDGSQHQKVQLLYEMRLAFPQVCGSAGDYLAHTGSVSKHVWLEYDTDSASFNVVVPQANGSDLQFYGNSCAMTMRSYYYEPSDYSGTTTSGPDSIRHWDWDGGTNLIRAEFDAGATKADALAKYEISNAIRPIGQSIMDIDQYSGTPGTARTMGGANLGSWRVVDGVDYGEIITKIWAYGGDSYRSFVMLGDAEHYLMCRSPIYLTPDQYAWTDTGVTITDAAVLAMLADNPYLYVQGDDGTMYTAGDVSGGGAVSLTAGSGTKPEPMLDETKTSGILFWDGANDYHVRVLYSDKTPDLPVSTASAWKVKTRFKWTALATSTVPFVGCWNNTTMGITQLSSVGIRPSDGLVTVKIGTVTATITIAALAVVDTWFNVEFVYDGTNLSVTVNGTTSSVAAAFTVAPIFNALFQRTSPSASYARSCVIAQICIVDPVDSENNVDFRLIPWQCQSYTTSIVDYFGVKTRSMSSNIQPIGTTPTDATLPCAWYSE